MTRQSPTRIVLTLLLTIPVVAQSALPVDGIQCECNSHSSTQRCCNQNDNAAQGEGRKCCCHRQATRRSCCHTRPACCQTVRNETVASHSDARGCQCRCRSQRQVPPTQMPVSSSPEVIKQLLSHDNCSTDEAVMPASFSGSRSPDSASILLVSPCRVQVLLCRWLT